MRSDVGVAGEGRVVSVPRFHSWDKCTMSLTNINLDWMSNTSSGLCIIYHVGPLFRILGCNVSDYLSSFLPQVLLPNPVVVPVRVPPLLNPTRVVPVQEQDPPPTPASLLLPIVGMHTVSYIPISPDYASIETTVCPCVKFPWYTSIALKLQSISI